MEAKLNKNTQKFRSIGPALQNRAFLIQPHRWSIKPQEAGFLAKAPQPGSSDRGTGQRDTEAFLLFSLVHTFHQRSGWH